MKCANFIGDALDQAAAEGFESVLLVGHVGKLVKLAGGIMNTHSRYADCRTELFCAYAAVCGGGQALCEALLDSATTDACIALLDQAGLRAPVMAACSRPLTGTSAAGRRGRIPWVSYYFPMSTACWGGQKGMRRYCTNGRKVRRILRGERRPRATRNS